MMNDAYMVLTVPPENRFRYRYDTEMAGTHGSLQGKRKGREKSVPTVELFNFPHEALIRVNLVTCQNDEEYYPHPHSLFVKEKLYQKKIYENWDKKYLSKTGHYSDPHYIRIGTHRNNFVARFEGMCIINSKKEKFHSVVKEKLEMHYIEQKYGTYVNMSQSPDETEDLVNQIEKVISSVDVDFVRLCFEAFREENGKLFAICPPIYSEPIGNAKSAKTGKLKISRINKCSGSCKGGDEIWMLVEKISKKGLRVRFLEEVNGKTIWQSSLEGDDLILHHQYAIIFKTPMYRDVNISSEVEVLMRLERSVQPNQACDFSEPITFVYEPLKNKINKDNLYRKESILAPSNQIHFKRPRTDSSSNLLNSYQNKRKPDDMDIEEKITFEDSTDSDIDQLLFDDKDSFEFDQAWAKFNVEEFLQFLSSDDVNLPLQKDGFSLRNAHRRDLFYKLYVLYSRLDENEIRKLTDEISNFKVSKKKTGHNKSIVEKVEVKDAASTLLSLRSKGILGNSTFRDQCGRLNKISESTDVCNLYEGRVGETNSTLPPSVTKKYSFVLNDLKNKELSGDHDEGKTKLNNINLGEEKPVVDGSSKKSSFSKYIIHESLKKENELTLRNQDEMEMICRLLNESGSWKNLMKMWDCNFETEKAEKSSNPTKFILDYVKQSHGELDLIRLRNFLEAANEKKALEILNEILL